MLSIDAMKIQLILMIIGQISGLSFNQPKFCPNASWNANATTFADINTVGANLHDIFIDTNNTIYVPNQQDSRIIIWLGGSTTPTQNISGILLNPFSLFVTTSGDIYVDALNSTGAVSKWAFNSTIDVPIMYACGRCWDLFIDISNNLYCSMGEGHQVVKKSLDSGSNAFSVIAGTGIAGTASNMLYYPHGVFVDTNFDLYVTDAQNNRIQLFQLGQLNGTTVVTGTITLNFPTGIALDADKYLFIVDYVNSRIVGSGPNGFRCLVGCTNSYGNASDQLHHPWSLSFDSYGNMFVTDLNNNRIQKFMLMTNSCDEATTTRETITSTVNNVQISSTNVPNTVTINPLKIVSYNQPKLDACATWNANAITFTTSLTVGINPYGIFINPNNTIYVADRQNSRIQIWLNDSINPTQTISGTLSNPYSIFVTINGDIYIDNSYSAYEVDKWILNTNTSISAMNVGASCHGLFVDISNTLYCSVTSRSQVVKKSLNSVSDILTIVAGGDCPGSTSYLLYSPSGIFVDTNFDLYVADTNNHRIQLFQSDQLSGITLIGSTSVNTTITLNYPSGIILDADKYLFIVDQGNNRIVGSGPNGFRCLVGCTNSYGNASDQLNSPQSMAFDSSGNMFVLDNSNNRLQKFILMTNSCDETTVAPTTTQFQIEQITSTEQQTTIAQQTSAGQQTTTEQQTTIPQQTSIGQQTTTDHPSSAAQQIPTITPSVEMITTSKPFASNQGCRSPDVNLIPGTSSLLFPVQFRRSQDFYIVSIIVLNCNHSLSITTQWTITNCTSTCSNQIQLHQTIITTFSELYIPARTLPYGTYELKLTVTMTNFPWLTTTLSVYARITPSGITPNLVQLGTSLITSGFELDLTLDPGTFSIDPDESVFNRSNWKYEYYCRIYGLSMFPNLQGSLLPIENSTMDSQNPSCLSNRTDNQTTWRYNDPIKSSLTILAGSLQANRTYQFKVYMESRRNSSLQATGYVLVRVEDTRPRMIIVGCVILTMCVPNLEIQFVNPTTQVALFSICVGNCSSIQNMRWNIYHGTTNSSSNLTQWTFFNQTTSYQNNCFFGIDTTNFTSTNQLFLSNPQINLWRFEVVYTFLSETSSSALNFITNQPPYNGSCAISPLNGTTSSVFTISCLDWFDEDEIKDYSLYIWTNDLSERTVVAFSSISTFQVRLPAGDDQTSLLHLIIYIRDESDCLTEYNMSSVTVLPDSVRINDLINDVQHLSNGIITNPVIQLLASENQNIVAQIIISLSQQFNKMNSDNLNKTISNDIPAASISVSPLGSQRSQGISMSSNISALDEYNKQLNSHANVREYLMESTVNLPITISNSIKLQASSLAQLTKATNQLTRTSLMIASKRCFQLTMALYSMATKIAYEDVQTAATQLIHCASNILTAVNGPLQQRATVLDIDSSRASIFPDDYDTDLESDWSNRNLFADGNDFSWKTIQKTRNIYYQKQLANQIMNQANEIISFLTLSLNIHLNIEQNFFINTSEVFFSLEMQYIKSLSNKIVKQVENAQIHLPSNFDANVTNNQKILLRSMMEPLASFGNSKFSSNIHVSRSLSLSILDHNANKVSIQTNMLQSFEIIIPRDPNLIIPSMILQNVTLNNSTLHNQLFHLHYVNITSTVTISVHLEIRPFNTHVAYLLIYKFDQLPQLNGSINQIDGWTLLCPFNLTNESIYTYFIDNQQTSGHQSLIFGLRELNSTEIIDVCSNSSIKNPPITNERYHFTSNYELRTYTSGCYYLDQNNQWKSDGLVVGPLTDHYQTQCFSTHLTTFAGGFVVLPEPINWNYVFANANFMRNKTIYLTVICASMIYVILILYARFQDKKDVEKLGVTPLPDNHQSDKYYYQILVFTGQRKDAGTKSKVHFVLSGNDDETHIRTLADSHRQILQRGGIDAFIMAVPKSLGLLNYIHIWHDNSGQGSSSSWFLKYLIIRDLQTMQKFHFISQRWFAVEREDGKIERVLPVASGMEKSEFSYVLSKKAYHSVSDGHLWFSIFSRPPSNKFTHVQRCTCCFVLLFLSMFLNIMYYDLKSEVQMNNSTNTVSLSIGPLHITSEQIGTGVIVELLSLLPSLLLIQLFRRLRSRQKQTTSLRQALYQIKPYLAMKNKNVTKQKSGLTFPWWCLFIAYGLCLILVGTSIFFIIARGIEFGDLKTQQWLTSILSGFFSSILLTQPMKIVCLAVFFAFFCRKSNDDKEANEHLAEDQIELDDDEEYLHSIRNRSLFTYRPRVQTNRLNDAEVVWARVQRFKEIDMWSIIRDALTYFCFLSLLYIITYSHQNSDSFLQVYHLRKYFLNSRESDYDYTKISTINDYWNWLEGSFVSNIRAQEWYNGDSPRNLSGYINDKSNRLIGWVTMRQLRIKSHLCSIRKMNFTCEYDYSWSNEEKSSFELGWKNETTTIKSNSTIQKAFRYQSDGQLDTYVYIGDHGSYSGGGYVYEFRGRLSDIQRNLSRLHQLRWIDQLTRAIIIQLTLYNPNVQLFTSVTLLVEFSSTGAIYPQSRFEPISFYTFTSSTQLICIIVYMILIIYFILMEVRSFFRLKWIYFYEFWSLIELGIIICSWMGVGIYVWRYREYARIAQLFFSTNGYAYINLQLSTYINNLLTFLYGFCWFFGTLKLIRLCRFNQRIYLFIQTLQLCAKELTSFAMMFSIVFMSFMCLFYLLFQSKLWSCSSLFQTAEMLFEMILMKFDAHELTDAAAFLGPFCFSLFIFIVVFVCMSIFISIINESFRQARESIHHDQKIYTFMLDRFLRWTGLKKRSKEEVYEERDAVMRSEYFDPIERFPDKIDQLLDALNRLYMTQRDERSRI